MYKNRMFWRLISRAVWFRKLPSIVAILAIMLGTGVIGGLVHVNYDMNQKMGKEFRTYGANLLVYPSTAATPLTPQLVDEVQHQIPAAQKIGLAPVSYSIVKIRENPIVLAGTWFDQMKLVSPYWNIEGNWITQRDQMDEAMVGSAVAKKYDLKPGMDLELTSQSQTPLKKLKIASIVTTGGKEDNQIFVSASLAKELTSKANYDIVLASVLAQGSQLDQTASTLRTQFPSLEAKPIKQMAESEAKMVAKIERLVYLVATVIVITTILTIMTTMVSMVMERRREVGLKKALGASQSKLVSEFLMEGILLGLVGSTLGIGLSYYLAQLIGQSVFHSDITFRMLVIPWSYLGALLVIAIGFVLPVRRIMDVEPAIVLKGE